MRRVNTFIGSPVERVEDLRFLRGRGQYVDDLARTDQWYATIVRSPMAHGRLRSIDVAPALAMPSVKAVLTARDIGAPIPRIPFRRPNPTIAPYAQPVIAAEIVRYVGEPLAVVLAEAPERAEDAAAAITFEIEELAVVVDPRAAMKGDVLLFPETRSNRAALLTAAKGDADAAFRAAAYSRREKFRTPRLTAMTMETRGLLAEWDATRAKLSISGAAKLPFFNRRAMAQMMGLAEEAVDYLEFDVGGGFGARGEFYPEDFLVAFAARQFGHPIKWVEDRREHFMAIAHSRESECEIEMAFDRDGRILGLRGDIHVDIGAYVRPNGLTPVRNAAQFTSGPYRIPNIALAAHALVSNKTPAGTYRGPGRFEGCFFCERMLDLAAQDMCLDRLDIRRRNLVGAAEMPYALASITPDDGFGDTACDSGDYATAFDRCVTEARWAEKSHLQGALIEGRYHGLGVACFIEGGASGPRESARMVAERDGRVSVYVGSSAVGQGIETIMAQIAADALELPLERISVYHGSTNYLAEGFGSYGSRATVMGGCAILLAADAFIDKFRAAAAARLGVAADEINIVDGAAHARDGRVFLVNDAALEGLSAEGTFSNNKATYTYGTAIAHVAVDAKTGHVEVIDYVVVDDVGRAINPLTLHGQVVGAAVQGMGSVFSEEIVYDENGQLLVGSLADYMIPVATDYPVLRAISQALHPSPNNPLGAKGAGEGGIIPVGGAVANAVGAALRHFGAEPKELPLTPARVWQLIREAELARRSPDGAKRNPGPYSQPAPAFRFAPCGLRVRRRRTASAMTVAASPAQSEPNDAPPPWFTRERLRAIRRPLTTLVVVLCAWEILARTVLTNRLFFAPPSDVALAAMRLWESGELQRHIWVSFSELIYGVLLAIVIGTAIGIVVGISQRVRDYTEIYITALYATPLVAVAPLLILWLGIGIASKVAVVFLTAVFPILINTISGVRATEALLIEVAQSFCATRRQIVAKVVLPSALPYILTGIRLGIGRGIVGVVVGELFGSQAGLGFLISTSGQTFDVPSLFVGIVTLAVAGVGLTFAAELVERHVLRWRRSVRVD